MNKEIMLTLKLATVGQIYLEMLEEYERLPANKFKKKNLIKQLTKEFEVDVTRDFDKAFSLDEETLLIVQQSYDLAISSIACRDIPSAVIQTQLWGAYRKEPKVLEATSHRILNKRN